MKKLNILFQAQPYTLQASPGRIWASSGYIQLTGPPGSTFHQGSNFFLSGSGFGTKSRAIPPLVQDTGADAAIGAVSPQWSLTYPLTSTGTDPTQGLVNRGMNWTPVTTNLGAPHPHITSVAGGGHNVQGLTDQASAGVYFAQNLGLPTTPCVLYCRYFWRCTPEWDILVNTGGVYDDQNFKQISYADASGITVNDVIINFDVVGQPGPPTMGWNNTTHAWQMACVGNNSATSMVENPDRNGHGTFWNNALMPINPANGWILRELEICIDSTIGPTGKGYIQLTEPAGNGLIVNYAGATDLMGGATPHNNVRWLSFGDCYIRNRPSPKNWVGLADMYLDMSFSGVSGHCARVIFGDAPTYTASVIRAPATLGSWTNTSITGTFNQDLFTTGMRCYAHVLTESGAVLDNVFNTLVG